MKINKTEMAMTILNDIFLRPNMNLTYPSKTIEHVKVVTTPLVICHNDHYADYYGVISWYDSKLNQLELIPFHIIANGDANYYKETIKI